MNTLNIVLSALTCTISLLFSFLVFRRFISRRGLHLLIWGIGLIFYGIGGFCEAYYGALGWNPLVFRLWYLSGALLVAAWLGQGTIYLLVKKSGPMF